MLNYLLLRSRGLTPNRISKVNLLDHKLKSISLSQEEKEILSMDEGSCELIPYDLEDGQEDSPSASSSKKNQKEENFRGQAKVSFKKPQASQGSQGQKRRQKKASKVNAIADRSKKNCRKRNAKKRASPGRAGGKIMHGRVIDASAELPYDVPRIATRRKASVQRGFTSAYRPLADADISAGFEAINGLIAAFNAQLQICSSSLPLAKKSKSG